MKISEKIIQIHKIFGNFQSLTIRTSDESVIDDLKKAGIKGVWKKPRGQHESNKINSPDNTPDLGSNRLDNDNLA